MVVAALSRLLGDWGGEILVAENARDALYQMAHCTKDVDAVLCDYRLPHDRSGLDLVAALREATDRTLPAIIISADTTPAVLKKVTESGLPLLSKPVTGRAISQALVQVLTD